MTYSYNQWKNILIAQYKHINYKRGANWVAILLLRCSFLLTRAGAGAPLCFASGSGSAHLCQSYTHVPVQKNIGDTLLSLLSYIY